MWTIIFDLLFDNLTRLFLSIFTGHWPKGILTMDKKRYDYTIIGLVKTEGHVSFDNVSVDTLPDNAKQVLMHYGAFVMLTRTLAGHEKDTDAEKKSLVKDTWDWLLAGCPKRIKSGFDGKAKAIAILEAQMATASKPEKAILATIIAKMKSE